MDLKELMAISGYPGLFKFVSQGRNAIIVESLEDKKRMSAYSTSKISTLEEIAVFTDSGEVPLAEVFKKIHLHSGGREVLPHKSSDNEIKKFFEEVIPEYDREKVYVSDMKKIIHWYNLLIQFDLLHPEDTEKEEKTPSSDDKNPGAPAGRKAEGYTGKKAEGNTGNTGRAPSRHQPGKSVRQQPRKS
jgi:hypothetical protein